MTSGYYINKLNRVRTHRISDIEKDKSCVDAHVSIAGWVVRIRDHGKVRFIDVWDGTGMVQAVLNETACSSSQQIRLSDVIVAQGTLVSRDTSLVNLKQEHGKIELQISNLHLCNKADFLPFCRGDNVNETQRMQYRYLDLRNPTMQANIRMKSNIFHAIHTFFHQHEFIQIETPFLTRSTPEGARDFLVPSRLHAGKMYALPQSPQIFKQLLMISGFDRYYQIVKCFRDEDLRADRQPEFLQLDMEMAFVREDDVIAVIENLMHHVFSALGYLDQWPQNIPKISYQDAMNQYGTDKPDLRLSIRLYDVTSFFINTEFLVLRKIARAQGKIIAISLPKIASQFSNKHYKDIMDFLSKYGIAGAVYIRVTDQGKHESNVAKFFQADEMELIIQYVAAHPGDCVVMIGLEDTEKITIVAGFLREYCGKKYNLYNDVKFAPCWVTDFPLMHLNKEGHAESVHHPFTGFLDMHDENNWNNLNQKNSTAYDFVVNGSEIGGGSIRIYNHQLQKIIFKHLGLNDNQIKKEFGFFLNALRSGAPPHGGFALGIDRFVALIAGVSCIRDVIPFPKTQHGSCLLTEAPDSIAQEQMHDLHLQFSKIQKL